MELDILCSQYHAIIWRLGAYPPTTFWITINVTSHQHWFLKHACRLRGILLGKSIHKCHRRKISVREITFCSLFPHLKGVSSISKHRELRDGCPEPEQDRAGCLLQGTMSCESAILKKGLFPFKFQFLLKHTKPKEKHNLDLFMKSECNSCHGRDQLPFLSSIFL